VLVVAACAQTEELLQDPALADSGLNLERASDSESAIARVERGGAPDVVLLAPELADPIRVAQRLHSLDRQGAVVVLADGGGEHDLRHALAVAPFLDGDVSMVAASDAGSLVAVLAAAAARTKARRAATAGGNGRETPPPLSARYLGTLLDSAPIGLVTLDESGGVIGWNRRAGDMLRVPEVEAVGSRFTDLFAADRERLEALIASLGTSGIDEQGEVFERGGRSFEITGARFAIRSGENGSLLILQDVTKRRAAERELEVERALMAAQADSSMVGIAVVGGDGSVERVNKRWTEIWGVDAETLRSDGERASRVMLEQVTDPDEFDAASERLAESDSGDYRDEATLKDGRTIERYGTYVRNDAGEVIGRIWFHTDITAHRREEHALRFLADATNVLSSSLDPEMALGHVADLAVPRIADWCTVEIADRPAPRPPVETQIVANPTPEQLHALARDERVPAELDPRSVMVVPIKIRERVFGTMKFVRSAPRPSYDADDVQLAEELARRVAIAIDNSRIHAELRKTARTLQESLLPPQLPAIRRLELGARFRPAGAGMEVGGDFYDIFEAAPDQWAIAIGDVCGKGAEAAALTALTRYTVRTAAMYEDEPRGVLRVLNQALLRQRGDFRFTTLVFCLIDLSAGRPVLRASCGGHPRPLLLRPAGTAEAVGPVGPLLGVLPDAEFHEQQVTLEPDDVLVLYTDGLTDALAPERILDETALLGELAQCGGLGAGEVSQRLERFALGERETRVPRDDIALVVAILR
jgi:PAS domain S-box-containing protein